MSTIHRKKIPIIIGLAIGLFLALAIVQSIVGGAGKNPGDIGDDYYLLLQELDHQGLLPPGGEEGLLSKLSTMTIDKSRISVTNAGASLDRVGLSDVIYFPLVDGYAMRMELKPQNWRDLSGGQLQALLRRISGFRLPVHQKSAYIAAGGAPASVSLELQYNNRDYRIVPVFEQDALVSVLITAGSKK